jgi:D-allulose-6-phosphate 3-epimerase
MTGHIKIAPSLICMDFLQIGKHIGELNKLADLYHCDIIDDHFAPAFGLPLEYLISLKKAATLPIDAHLMVENVERVSDQLMGVGVDMITLQIEGVISNVFRIIGKIKDAGIKVGIAINPITPLENLNYILSTVDKITILTFDPGIAGQKLVSVTLNKVSQLAEIKRDNAYSFDIEVDGSCNEKNYWEMRSAGANQFVVGTSGLFCLDDDIKIAWEKMKRYMNDNRVYAQ